MEEVKGIPLSPEKQRELSEQIEQCHTDKATRMIGCWCSHTCFAALVEIIDGVPVLWHFTGPCTSDSAEKWINGMVGEAERAGTGLRVQ